MDPCEKERKLLKEFAFADPSMIRRVCGRDAEPIYWELLVNSKWAKVAAAKTPQEVVTALKLSASWAEECVDEWVDTRTLTTAKVVYEKEEEKSSILHRAAVRFGRAFPTLASLDTLPPAVQEVLRLSAKDYRERYPWGTELVGNPAIGDVPSTFAIQAKPEPPPKKGQGEG